MKELKDLIFGGALLYIFYKVFATEPTVKTDFTTQAPTYADDKKINQRNSRNKGATSHDHYNHSEKVVGFGNSNYKIETSATTLEEQEY